MDRGAAGLLQHHTDAATCYALRDNDNGIGIVSQNFEATFDAYDAQGADDFELTKKCKLKTVTVDGAYFNGVGPADSFNVTIYRGKTEPGAVLLSCQDAPYTDGTGLGGPITITCKGTLKSLTGIDKGKYWLSVQSNLDATLSGPSGQGEWDWNTNNTIRYNPSRWQNPGDGFGTGCTTYQDTTTCIPSGEGGDFSSQLN